MWLPLTWRVVCAKDLLIAMQLPFQTLPALWRMLASYKMLEFFKPLQRPPQRQEVALWEQLAKLFMPGSQRDFIRTALWQRLTVGARTGHVHRRPRCFCFCGVLETVNYALSQCRFFGVTSDIASKTLLACMGQKRGNV